MQSLELARSVAASIAQQGRGIVTRSAKEQPEDMLELYEMEGCPFSRLVREALTHLDLDAMIYPCPHGGLRYRPLVEKLGGRQQFPFLMDPNTGTDLYESADIIEYLYQQYGGRPAPARWQIRSIRTSASLFASASRGRRGLHCRTSVAPDVPLILYSFEASPFARLVRERLTELELPFELRQCGRDQWQDWVLPQARDALHLPYQPAQRHRRELMERAGRVAVPYLIDPNQDKELFEARAIIAYLETTYAG